MECFYEQFQTKDYGSLEKILNILSKVSLVIAILFATMLNLVFAAAFGLIYLVIFILSRKKINKVYDGLFYPVNISIDTGKKSIKKYKKINKKAH